MNKEGEFEYGVYIGCAIISYAFVFLIIISGLFVVIFGRIYVEKFLPLFCFFLTVVLGLAVYYTYKIKKYIKKVKIKRRKTTSSRIKR